MNSRCFVLAFSGLLLTASITRAQTAVTAPAGASSIRPPNIVFILTDDMGYSDPGCYGGTFAPTPNIDALASQGVRFNHFYDDAPLCSPSRAAFITGMFPARVNFTNFLESRANNADAEQTDFLPTTAPALARALKAAGYATAHYGKWHLGGGRDVKNAPPFSAYGYDEHVGTWESPEPDPQITATNWIWSPKDPVKRWDRTGYFVDHALDFLSRHKDQPSYVEVWPDDVHTPWVPSAEAQGVKDGWTRKPDFKAVLAQYDVQMGRLFDGIKKLGLDQNTIVIFTSDNGPLPSFNHERTGGLRGSKLSLYEGGVRVPFIVRWTGHTTPGRVDDQTVLEAVDLFPTLCAITHAAPPSNASFDGEDMTGALVQTPTVRTKTIFWEYGREGSTVFHYPGKPYDRSPHLAVREGKWKLLVNPDGTSTELYDLQADPNETTNLMQQQPALTQKLREEALAWKKSLPVLAKSGPVDAHPQMEANP
jgi:arylsulfatase A-like enzyme